MTDVVTDPKVMNSQNKMEKKDSAYKRVSIVVWLI